MQRFEYKVVPAPRRGEKLRGVKTTEDRFAIALTGLMNRMGAEGWEYIRADALPCDERVGFTGTKTTFQNMLVFRRVLDVVRSHLQAEVAPDLAAASPYVFPGGDMDDDDLAEPRKPRLSAAEAPLGAAPSLGPAKPGLAAE